MRLLERASPVLFATLLGALVALSVGVGGLFLLRGAERESMSILAETTQAGAEAVGRAVAREVNRALYYGIPLDRLNKVQPYLRRIVDGSPQVEAIGISDETGKLLYATADDVHGMTFPLEASGQAVGTVVLEAAPPLVRGLISRVEASLATAALFCGVVAGLVIYFFMAWYLRAAEARLAASLDAIRDGRNAMVPQTAGRGVVVEAFRTLDRALEPIGAAKRRVEDAAATVRGIDFDGSLKDKVEELLADAGDHRLAPAPEALAARKLGAPLWPAAVVIGLYCAAAPLLANYAIDREWSFVPRLWWPSVPIIVEIVCACLTAIAVASLPAALRKPAGILGLLLAALAVGAVAFSRSYPLFLGLRGLAGAGLGLLLGSVFVGQSRRGVLANSWPLILFVGAGLGPLLGGLIAEAVGRRMAFLLAGAGLALCLMLVPRLYRTVAVSPASSRTDGLWMAVQLMALGVVLGAVSLVWIPTQPGYDSYLLGGGLIAGVGLASTLLALWASPAVTVASVWGLPLGLIAGLCLVSIAGVAGWLPLMVVLVVAAGMFLLGLVLKPKSGRHGSLQTDQAG